MFRKKILIFLVAFSILLGFSCNGFADTSLQLPDPEELDTPVYLNTLLNAKNQGSLDSVLEQFSNLSPSQQLQLLAEFSYYVEENQLSQESIFLILKVFPSLIDSLDDNAVCQILSNSAYPSVFKIYIMDMYSGKLSNQKLPQSEQLRSALHDLISNHSESMEARIYAATVLEVDSSSFVPLLNLYRSCPEDYDRSLILKMIGFIFPETARPFIHWLVEDYMENSSKNLTVFAAYFLS